VITDLVLAHDPLLVALPFFVPAALVVAAVAAVVVRDRRQGDDEPAEAPSEGGDGSRD